MLSMPTHVPMRYDAEPIGLHLPDAAIGRPSATSGIREDYLPDGPVLAGRRTVSRVQVPMIGKSAGRQDVTAFTRRGGEGAR